MVIREKFSKEEAEAKVGLTIRTKVKFSGVPTETTGRIAVADESGDGFTVGIDWSLPDRQFGATQRPLRDWFTKGEYERYLVEEERGGEVV